jgi:hypothetical protein
VALPGGLLVTAQASASTVSSSQNGIVESGGMVAASAVRAGAPSPKAASAKVPSCASITYKGNAGAIHVQTNGSLPPAKAKKGKIFHITATHHATANGKNYGSVPNECIIP